MQSVPVVIKNTTTEYRLLFFAYRILDTNKLGGKEFSTKLPMYHAVLFSLSLSLYSLLLGLQKASILSPTMRQYRNGGSGKSSLSPVAAWWVCEISR